MKLDKMKFAKLVAHCVANGMSTGDYEVDRLDELCEVEAPTQPTFTTIDLHTFMALMQEGIRKIDAIKQYRMMTGYGLKESKDIVEKYWPNQETKYTRNELVQKLKESDLAGEDYITVEKFINNI